MSVTFIITVEFKVPDEPALFSCSVGEARWVRAMWRRGIISGGVVEE
jgi:hypothetical protein